MATSTEVTNIDSGIVTKSNYRANVQAIPFTLTGVGDGTHTISKKLPEECRVISATVAFDALGGSATVDLGVAGSTNGIIDGAASANEGVNRFPSGTANEAYEVFNASGSVDVGGKILIITIASAGGTANLSGHVLIATNE
tara:strand:- start:37 stop:459 length:423 start_codon:yes stop_codon:yes gene_type:complete